MCPLSIRLTPVYKERKVGECKGEIKVVETGLTKAKEEIKEEMKPLEERSTTDQHALFIGLWCKT